MGFSWLISKIVSKTVAEFVVKALAWTVLSLAITSIFTEVFATGGWIETTTSGFFSSAAGGVALIAGAAEIVFQIYKVLHSNIRTKVSLVQRFSGFGLALGGLLLSVAGSAWQKGPALAVTDFLSAMLALIGFVTYMLESRRPESKTLDLLSSFSQIFETFVAYGSLPVVGAQIGIHKAKGDYDG